MKISLKHASSQEKVVQLGDLNRGFGRHSGRKKVIVVNLGLTSA